jgi:HSP20 family protein
MALIRWTPRTDLWDPFNNLTDIREEMNRLFNNSFRRIGRGEYETAFLPPMDVSEEKEAFLVKADLPGLSKEDVSVSLQENYLTIKGEKKHEMETKDAQYYRQERVHGAFARTIELPATVDAKRIDAQFKNGVLSVRLPKSEEAKPKQIEVKVN